MDAYYIDASVAPYYYAKPPQAAMTAPHLISQRRMQELVAPESSSSSSAPSSSSSSSPVSSLPTVLTVSEIEEKLANALIACRAALHVSEEDALESDVSTDDESDEDMDDDDFSSEDDSMLDADEDDVDDDEEEEEDLVPVRPDDTYERRMRRVSAWRDAVAAEAPVVIAPTSPALSRKRKADSDCETAQSACAKRARIAHDALPATCAACGGAFPTLLALKLHGLPMNLSEACRAAVAYQLEA
ncbi:hypothetical protein AURDEDRAFT_113080 [Auricularia subglabra TFB-10046 SS5]|nr:hypothetical protein AURDEDRAFT_113080 [Auricularia subglabra TFB-10046 SS5]